MVLPPVGLGRLLTMVLLVGTMALPLVVLVLLVGIMVLPPVGLGRLLTMVLLVGTMALLPVVLVLLVGIMVLPLAGSTLPLVGSGVPAALLARHPPAMRSGWIICGGASNHGDSAAGTTPARWIGSLTASSPR